MCLSSIRKIYDDKGLWPVFPWGMSVMNCDYDQNCMILANQLRVSIWA